MTVFLLDETGRIGSGSARIAGDAVELDRLKGAHVDFHVGRGKEA